MIAFEVVRRSGYETLHIAFSKYASLVDQQVVVDTLGKWGATHQSAFERFYTIMDHVGFGFAARCAAAAMPRGQQPDYSRAMPRVRA